MKFIYSIKFKIFIGVLTILILLIGGMVLTIQWSFERSFLRYVNTAEQRYLDRLSGELAGIYTPEQGWELFRRNPRLWRRLKFTTFGRTFEDREEEPPWEEPDHHDDDFHQPPEPEHGPKRRPGKPRVALLDADRQLVAGRYQPGPDDHFTPITVANREVGYLVVKPMRSITDRHDLAFVRQLHDSFLLIAVVMAVLAFLLSMLLARPMLRRIESLKGATRELTAGNFRTRLQPDSRDEIGVLAQDFNRLAGTLEKNESARQAWIADISHELRTPISILRGELEALQDGVRKQTPETLQRLHKEVRNLERLVHDLYELSMSDIGALSYQKSPCKPYEILQQCIAVFSEEFDNKKILVKVTSELPEQTTLLADADRLKQLFSNLLLNSLRYTDADGLLQVILSRQADNISICFRDSAPGVADADLEKIFDRLFRIEGSRSRASGGAGLGLAICRNIVEAHDGSIQATASPLGGVQIDILLPLTE